MQPGNAQGAGNQFGDLPWTSVFQDEVLQGLIKEALTNNYDLRIAATRVLQANANLGIVRANQFPTLNGTGSANYGKDEVQFNNRIRKDSARLGSVSITSPTSGDNTVERPSQPVPPCWRPSMRRR